MVLNTCGCALQVLKQLRHLNYTDTMGERVRFDENADTEANYTIINWHRSAEDGSVVFREVGHYSMQEKRGAQLVIDKTKIMWNGHSSEVSKVELLQRWWWVLCDYDSISIFQLDRVDFLS